MFLCVPVNSVVVAERHEMRDEVIIQTEHARDSLGHNLDLCLCTSSTRALRSLAQCGASLLYTHTHGIAWVDDIKHAHSSTLTQVDVRQWTE